MTPGMHGTGVRRGLGSLPGRGVVVRLGVGDPLGVRRGAGVRRGDLPGVRLLLWRTGVRTATGPSDHVRDGLTTRARVMATAAIVLQSAVA